MDSFLSKNNKGIVILIGMILLGNEVKSEEIDSLITGICIASFNTEMERAGKPPSTEIGDFTCNCFVNKLNNGSSIENAHQICKNKASKVFNLSTN